jgi:hypothetical protein
LPILSQFGIAIACAAPNTATRKVR